MENEKARSWLEGERRRTRPTVHTSTSAATIVRSESCDAVLSCAAHNTRVMASIDTSATRSGVQRAVIPVASSLRHRIACQRARYNNDAVYDHHTSSLARLTHRSWKWSKERIK
jgi:hypothetical protein